MQLNPYQSRKLKKKKTLKEKSKAIYNLNQKLEKKKSYPDSELHFLTSTNRQWF